MLENLLVEAKYDKDEMEFLVKGFKEGFQIGFQGPRNIARKSPDLKLEYGTKWDLWKKVMKEVAVNRFAGPFKEPPYDYYHQSLIGLVPKSNGDVRLIFHLSYPRSGMSINSMTPKHLCTLKYRDLNDVIQLYIEAGKGCYTAKADMQSAFRNLPIRSEDWPLLIMKAEHPETGELCYFVDKCLPFGASISCAHFQCFSNTVEFIFQHRTGNKATNYLDDFFFAALLKLICDGNVDAFLQICEEINFPVAIEKTVRGTTVIIFLGILIDTVNQTISIQLDKRKKAI